MYAHAKKFLNCVYLRNPRMKERKNLFVHQCQRTNKAVSNIISFIAFFLISRINNNLNNLRKDLDLGLRAKEGFV